MIVQPSLPDHPKFVVLKQQIGPVAMEVLFRLWGYAQTIKSSCLGRVDASYIKSITRYRGCKDKLWEALALPQLDGKAAWLDVHDDGNVVVHEFDQYNASLNSARKNGKAGGRPTGPPIANPSANPSECPPALDGWDGMDGMGLDGMAWVRSVLNSMFGREEKAAWSHLEESSLAEICRRANYAAEFKLIFDYRAGLPVDRRKYFPQTLAALLTGWTGVLDRARGEVLQKNAPAASRPAGFQEGDSELWWVEPLDFVQAASSGAYISGDKKKGARIDAIIAQRKGGQ